MENLNLIEQTYRRLRASGRPISRLFLGNPTEQGFRFPPQILQEVYSRYFQSQVYQPHPKGLKSARDAVCRFYGAQGVQVDAEQVLLTAGSSESFLYLFSLLGNEGGNFLTPQPSYPLFDHIAEMAKVELRHYRLAEENNWEIDLQDLRQKTDSQTRAIVLVSPHNPTGSVVNAEQAHELVEWANTQHLPLICDEVFSEFYFGAGAFPRIISVARPELAFTLNGISKMFALPSMKLSWIAVSGEVARVVAAVDSLETMNDTFLTCHIPIQEALPELFSRGQEFLKFYRQEVGRRRSIALELLSASKHVQVVEPRGGFYLMGRVTKPLKISEEEFVIRLMEETGVFVHPGYFYDYEQGIHFVISFLLEEKALRSGIGHLLSFIEDC